MKLVRHVVELFLRPRRSFMMIMMMMMMVRLIMIMIIMMMLMIRLIMMMMIMMMIMMMMIMMIPTCDGTVFEAEKIIYLSSVFMKSTFERIGIVGCYKDLNEVMLLSIGNARQLFTQFL